MKKALFAFLSWITGRNFVVTPKEVIIDQLNEPRPLPLGMSDFDLWADRILSGAMLQVDHESAKFTLANLILHLGPTEDHKPDAYFIHSLRKLAANQIADAKRIEIRDRTKARLAAEEEARKAAEAAVEEATDAASLTLPKA